MMETMLEYGMLSLLVVRCTYSHKTPYTHFADSSKSHWLSASYGLSTIFSSIHFAPTQALGTLEPPSSRTPTG